MDSAANTHQLKPRPSRPSLAMKGLARMMSFSRSRPSGSGRATGASPLSDSDGSEHDSSPRSSNEGHISPTGSLPGSEDFGCPKPLVKQADKPMFCTLKRNDRAFAKFEGIWSEVIILGEKEPENTSSNHSDATRPTTYKFIHWNQGESYAQIQCGELSPSSGLLKPFEKDIEDLLLKELYLTLSLPKTAPRPGETHLDLEGITFVRPEHAHYNEDANAQLPVDFSGGPLDPASPTSPVFRRLSISSVGSICSEYASAASTLDECSVSTSPGSYATAPVSAVGAEFAQLGLEFGVGGDSEEVGVSGSDGEPEGDVTVSVEEPTLDEMIDWRDMFKGQ